MSMEILDIDFDAGEVRLSDGTILEITNIMNEEGEECEYEDAVVLVASLGALCIVVELEWVDKETRH